jgi:hypothetical protein
VFYLNWFSLSVANACYERTILAAGEIFCRNILTSRPLCAVLPCSCGMCKRRFGKESHGKDVKGVDRDKI